MVNLKTPGKQRTISSFFAVKSSQPTSSPAAAAQPASSPAAAPKPTSTRPKPSTQKRAKLIQPVAKKPAKVTRDDEDDEDEDLEDAPPVTRRRTLKRTLEEKRGEDDDDDEDLYSVPAPKKIRGARKTPEVEDKAEHAPPRATQSGIAAQYRYDSSQPSSTMEVDTELDPALQRKKQQLREKFVKKLGRIELPRPSQDDEGAHPGEEGGDEEDAEPAAPVTKRGKGKAVASKKSGPKLTPLEKQVVDIKKKHPDTVLIVEVGYKFRFFGEDARIASQNLSIMCIPGKFRFDNDPSEAHYDRLASAMIPVPRLHVHVKRLIANGYKVGVVRQVETAALKAAGDNKNAPFGRKLTNLYTKGTYIDDIDGMEGSDLSSGAGSGGAPNTGFLLCITEKPGGGSGTDEKVHVGIVAVQPSTGEVIYDEFDDGFMRSEIETRLLHSTKKPSFHSISLSDSDI